MSLTSGDRLGHYEVTGELGAGGMGVVYRARDTKLDRDVALKVLPPAFTEDPDRLARFEREAKVLASLNHPGIAAIHGLEESKGVKALVLELVEGSTLAARIAKGSIPLEEALPIAKQIAEALEAAHEAGVIHRDLKPANVKVKADGTVKVLDFGLAKALNPTPESDPSQSPTLTAAATQMGVIMGTAAYMSPEQARGKPVDKRADIWAFGCVLYEMLVGKPAFEGDTVTDIFSAIVSTEPDRSALPTELSPVVHRMFDRCLEKDPRQRLRDIGEMRVALEGPLDGTPEPPLVSSDRKGLPLLRRASVAWSLTVVLGLAFLYTISQPGGRPVETQRPVTTVSIDLEDTTVLAFVPGLSMALSPDGRYLVYSAAFGSARSTTRLRLRDLRSFDTQSVGGTEGAGGAFFSPDSRWIGFSSGNGLYRVSVDGGAPLKLCDHAQTFRGGSWGDDGTIVFADGSGLYRVSSEGGQAEPVSITTELNGWSLSNPQLLPSGRTVLVGLSASRDGRVYRAGLVSLRDGSVDVLDELGAAVTPRFSATGHLLFAVRNGPGSPGLGGTVMAVPFDDDVLRITGAPVSLLDNVYVGGGARYAVSANGSLVYTIGNLPLRSLSRVARNGTRAPLSSHHDHYHYPRLSPTDDQLAVVIHGHPGPGHSIWLFDTARDTRRPLTLGGDSNYPTWTPDGKYVAFGRSEPSGGFDIYWQQPEGSGEAELLVSGPMNEIPRSWSADGQLLAFERFDPANLQSSDVWVLPIGGEPVEVLATSFNEREPALSPDGSRLAYVSNESGSEEVYVRSYPDLTNTVVVSSGGGQEPLWSRDGQVLYYRNPAADELYAVPFPPGETVPGARQTVVVGRFDTYLGGGPSYDVSSDGSYFVMLGIDGGDTGTEVRNLRLVLNWDEMLDE